MSRLLYPFLISVTLAAGSILYLEKQGEDPLVLLALTQAQAQTDIGGVSPYPTTGVGSNWGSGPSAGLQAHPSAPVATRPDSWPGGPPASASPPANPWSPPPATPAPSAALAMASDTPQSNPIFSPPPAASSVSFPGASLNGTSGQPAGAPPMTPVAYPQSTPAPAAAPPSAYVPSASMPPSQAAADANAISDIPNAQIIARVGQDVILAGDIYGPIDAALANFRGKVPDSQLEMQRTLAARQALDQLIEMKLMAVEARRNLPPESRASVEEKLSEQFEKEELPRLLKQYEANSRAELEAKLREKGTSLDRMRRTLSDGVLGSQWRMQKLKIDEEVSHEQMLHYYHQHAAEFEQSARVRWEQVCVRISRFPDKQAAFQAIAAAGNQIIDGRPFAEVARTMSDGATASEGGQHKWTNQGSLTSKVLDEALFSLPIGALSPILEDDRYFHIVRVIERTERGRRPFLEAQVEIRAKIREQRIKAESEKYLASLRANTKVWTIFDGPEPIE